MDHKVKKTVQQETKKENDLKNDNESDYLKKIDEICQNSEKYTLEDIDSLFKELLIKDKINTLNRISSENSQNEQNSIDNAIGESLKRMVGKYGVHATVISIIGVIMYWGLNIWSTTSNMNDYLIRIIKIGENNSSNINVNKDRLKDLESEFKNNISELKQYTNTIQDIVKNDASNIHGINDQLSKITNKLDMLDIQIQTLLIRNKYSIRSDKNISSATETIDGNK